jgi:hypothetical protein
MLIYKGGHKVGKGTYWDVRKTHRIDVAQECVLSGGEASTYLRMSSGVMLLSGPIIGFVYVIYLPFIEKKERQEVASPAYDLGREDFPCCSE